jgi:hypothetical protein
MKVSQDSVLQAAAVITAAKIQVGGTLAAAGGEKLAQAAAKGGIKATKVLEESIKEVLDAIDHIEKEKSHTALKTWAKLGED